jgi:hypothetical protein
MNKDQLKFGVKILVYKTVKSTIQFKKKISENQDNIFRIYGDGNKI